MAEDVENLGPELHPELFSPEVMLPENREINTFIGMPSAKFWPKIFSWPSSLTPRLSICLVQQTNTFRRGWLRQRLQEGVDVRQFRLRHDFAGVRRHLSHRLADVPDES